MNQGRYEVAEYQERLSIRWVGEFDTTVYADTIVATFDTEEEAKEWVMENTDPYGLPWWAD